MVKVTRPGWAVLLPGGQGHDLNLEGVEGRGTAVWQFEGLSARVVYSFLLNVQDRQFKSSAPWAVVLGDEEALAGTLRLKPLRGEGEEQQLTWEDAVSFLAKQR